MDIKQQNEKINQWVIEKVRRDYPEDISLIISCDDLRMPEDQGQGLFDYYIPETERGYGLARTFIVAGKGYDLYPRSWERIAQMAALDDCNITCLDRGEVLYARSEEDRQKFYAFQQTLRQNLLDPAFSFQKALERLRGAMEIYQTMMFEESAARVRLAAGYIADYLSMAVAFVNHRYFKASQMNQTEELAEMAALPEGYLALYEKLFVTDGVEALRDLAHEMIAATRRFLAAHKAPAQPGKADFRGLASWYHELIYTWRRIDLAAAQGDYKRAFCWGCYLQQELDTVSSEFNLPKTNLMDIYQADDLHPLQKRAQALEQEIVRAIQSHGVKLDQFDSVEEFLSENP